MVLDTWGNTTPPSSYHTPYSTAIGKSISTPTFPYYYRHMKHWPAFLVQSQNPAASNNVTRAIVRIQDKRYEEENDSTGLWADYVFKSSYNLMTLPEVEQSIKQNGHLPRMPSANDVKTNGINVAEVQAKMLEKIEELTLYMIEMKKENEQLKHQINKLK